LAVVAGFIGKLPFAGMSLYNIHYLACSTSNAFQRHATRFRERSIVRESEPASITTPYTSILTIARLSDISLAISRTQNGSASGLFRYRCRPRFPMTMSTT
jgi:hypothetical protein